MDAQLRKERGNCDVQRTRNKDGSYTVILIHDTEEAIWRFFKGTNKRWYGTNDLDNRVIDAPTLKCGIFDLRMGYFK